MIPALPDNRTSWIFKFCECALVATALLNLLLIPLEFMPFSFFEKYGQYFALLLAGMIVVAVLGSLIYTWIWHLQEQTDNINSALYHTWFQVVIRYWLSLSISSYGFAKILKTQFQTPEFFLDMPLSSVNGMGLTWYFFGYSYPYSVIIALFQLAGAVLLLYRRSTLLGVMILLPVMINIVLINIFFNIGIGAFFTSVSYTLALLFFLFLYKKRLLTIFWDTINSLPAISLRYSWLKHGLRVLPIFASFLLLKALILIHPNDQILRGTWKIEKLVRNGQTPMSTAWLTDTKAWNRIYFAGSEGCAFSPNPFRFEASVSMLGTYKFDNQRKKLEVMFYNQDTLQAQVSNMTTDAMRIQGILGKDTLDMQLTRLQR